MHEALPGGLHEVFYFPLMNTGQIKKSKLTANFTTLPNSIFQDKNLSLKAIGLLGFLLHLPDQWIVNKTRLHSFLKDGRDAVLAAFAELEKFGYIETEEIRDKGRFVGFNYIVSGFPKNTQRSGANISEIPETEKPIPENPETVEPIPEKPIPDNPNSEKPIPENPELLNTNSIKEEISKEEISKDEPAAPGNLFGEPEPPKHLNGKNKIKPGAKILPTVTLPFDSELFRNAWGNWKEYKAGEFKFKYKTPQSEQAALNDLCSLSDGREENAIKIINHTMGKGWKGFQLPENLKQNGNAASKTGTNGHQSGRFTNNTTAADRLNSINSEYSSWETGRAQNGAGR